MSSVFSSSFCKFSSYQSPSFRTLSLGNVILLQKKLYDVEYSRRTIHATEKLFFFPEVHGVRFAFTLWTLWNPQKPMYRTSTYLVTYYVVWVHLSIQIWYLIWKKKKMVGEGEVFRSLFLILTGVWNSNIVFSPHELSCSFTSSESRMLLSTPLVRLFMKVYIITRTNLWVFQFFWNPSKSFSMF